MEIKIGFAKTAKHGAEISGASADIAERTGGGLSIILANAQGGGIAAHNVSSMVASRAAALIAGGERDERVSGAVHDFLYENHGKKMPCALSIIGADIAAEKIVISRNSTTPVIVCTNDYEAVYDDASGLIGLPKHKKPNMYELPLEAGIVVATFTEGTAQAGKNGGRRFETEKIVDIVKKNLADDADYIAREIMDYALELDKNRAGADMAVAVLAIAEGAPSAAKIETASVVYKF